MKTKLYYICSHGYFGLRLFNRGFIIKDYRQNRALFSERHGYVRWFRLSHFGIRFFV